MTCQLIYELPGLVSGQGATSSRGGANGNLEGARASLLSALEIHPEYVNARNELETLEVEIDSQVSDSGSS